MTKITCPVCMSPVERGDVLGEFQPVELDDQGVPYALAIGEGYGLPVVGPGEWPVQVEIEGHPVKRCLAFDRRAGNVWFAVEDGRGNLIVQGGDIVIDQAEGRVTVTRS